ncbi:hypothetical protein BS47DRAFT_1382474 [Hydnum rufescens UP504]|uniref:DUF6593 domain-containing protein n=1 Tax=Hydnum rufescens UP504 TaxID=1448309 RepID=A0A9P6DTP3_9AGAM|nr:hypothetical protein BS47DRAFT_1382474 [Hydnum rufescens UP504]
MKASSAGMIELQFTHDNPSNTTVIDMTGHTLYIVKTTHDPVTVTVLTKMLGSRSFSPDEELFLLEWRDVRSDKISVRGSRPVDFSAILSPCLPLSSSRKFTFDGKRYRWADIMGEPRLYLQGNKIPLAQFNKSWPEIPQIFELGSRTLSLPGLLQ